MDNDLLFELQDAPTVGSLVGPQSWVDDSELRLSGSIFSQLRVLEGKVAGLNKNRFGGSAKVIPGVIRQNGLPVPIQRILMSGARREGLRHHDHRMLVTVPLRTPKGATIEWLLLEDNLSYAIRRLTSSHHAHLLSEETVS